MAEIILCSPHDKHAQYASSLRAHRDFPVARFSSFQSVVCSFFQRGNRETDVNHPVIVCLAAKTVETAAESLESLSFGEKDLLLSYFFSHLNLIVIDVAKLAEKSVIDALNSGIDDITKLISDRITRVQTWTGTGASNVDDCYKVADHLSHNVATMASILNANMNKSEVTTNQLVRFRQLMVKEIDFKSLLSDHSTSHLSKLCNIIGHWSFPAHELSNDDLVYCVYLIINYCLNQLKIDKADIDYLSSNELLCLVFMVRDTYKNGNPFHNFRHAVDVVQACFHYVIRLTYLPSFTQFQKDPKADELLCLNMEKFGNAIELMPLSKKKIDHDKSGSKYDPSITSLNTLQTLALLLAALGHDVGHPGVTNAFMTKYNAPASLLYNERSVLESFHTSVFINKVLSINWPTILNLETDDQSKLTFKDLIISSILATDMAEHFEYIDKLTHFKSQENVKRNKIRLISSLLIKCADISNVTRPTRVSSQWASVLAREFDEVSKLESQITTKKQVKISGYDKVPMGLDEVLRSNPTLHKGQIFFINTFAENLFNNIGILLPELKFTYDIVKENKEFWLSRDST